MRGQHILGLEHMVPANIESVLNAATEMKKVMKQDVKKLSTLRGKAIVNVFFENSTRTRSSFELAGKYLGADVINIAASTSSVVKGESLRDTLLTVQSMGIDAIVMRHSAEGAAQYATRYVKAVVINAGDGAHEHPSQGLLDLLTIRQHHGEIAGKKVAIIGDIRHSRVARSNIWGLLKMGAEVHLGGPKTLIPKEMLDLGVKIHHRVEDAIVDADVINVLRIQLERQKTGFFPTAREYSRIFGINDERLTLAKKNVLVMHPGPMNRGLEISPDVAYGHHSGIEEQVNNGVAVRMALLTLTLTDGEQA